MTILTPRDLAFILDLRDAEVRSILRGEYKDQRPGKGNRWTITPRMARRVTRLTKKAR